MSAFNSSPALELAVAIWKVGAKPGQKLPAPYRYLGHHPMGGLSGEMNLPSCPILACISAQPQLQALPGPPWVPEASLEWCLLWRELSLVWTNCQGLCFLKIPNPHNWSYMMTLPGMSKQPEMVDSSPSTHPTSSEGPPGRAEPTLGFLVYHRLRGGQERVPGPPLTYLVAWPDLPGVRFTVLMNAPLCFNYWGCGERERSLTGHRARSKGKSTVSSPCNKEHPKSSSKPKGMENILCILPGLHGDKGTQAYSDKSPRVGAGGEILTPLPE